MKDLIQAVRGSGLVSGLVSSDSDRSSTAISFGARQAIIVRNNDSRKALLSMPEFENATILTIAECKGATPLPLIVRFPSTHNLPTHHLHVSTRFCLP